VSAVFLLGLLGCDSGSPTSNEGTEDPPPGSASLDWTVSVHRPSNAFYDVLYRRSGDTDFEDIPVDNGALPENDNRGGIWSPDGSVIWIDAIRLAPQYDDRPEVRYVVERDSLGVFPVNASFGTQWLHGADPFHMEASPAGTKLAIQRQANDTFTSFRLEVYDVAAESTVISFDGNTAGLPLGWLSETRVLALQSGGQQLRIFDAATATVAEEIDLDPDLFSDRLGSDWRLLSGKLHPDKERLLLGVGRAIGSVAPIRNQVALYNLSTGQTERISDDSGSSDGRPVWGPGDTAYYVSSNADDASFKINGHVVSYNPSTLERRVEVEPSDAGNRSIIGFDLYWDE
jgi:hypothetical protein